MSADLHSPVLGELYLMEDTAAVFCGEIRNPRDEMIRYSVHCSTAPGLSAADRVWEIETRVAWLLANEPAARRNAAEAAVVEQAFMWEDGDPPGPPPPPEEFAAALELEGFNCFPDDSYECWYSTPDTPDNVAAHDFVMEFNGRLEIISVGFDG